MAKVNGEGIDFFKVGSYEEIEKILRKKFSESAAKTLVVELTYKEEQVLARDFRSIDVAVRALLNDGVGKEINDPAKFRYRYQHLGRVITLEAVAAPVAAKQ
jgi:hypothetical protein